MNGGDDNSDDQIVAYLREIAERLERIEEHLETRPAQRGDSEADRDPDPDPGPVPDHGPVHVPDHVPDPGPVPDPDHGPVPDHVPDSGREPSRSEHRTLTPGAGPGPAQPGEPEPEPDHGSGADPDSGREPSRSEHRTLTPGAGPGPAHGGDGGAEPGDDTDAGDDVDAPRPEPVTPQPSFSETFDFQKWISRLAIGLLLFGLAFFLNYAAEEGYLTDPMKVGLGFIVATSLAWVGWRLRGDRQRFAQILLGGAVASYYITIFGAYQLYGLVPHPVAFSAMAMVTLAAFVLAHRWAEPVLSVIGALGGFGTPIILKTPDPDFVALSVYNGALVSGMIAIYLARGWRHLLALTAVGGWLVLILPVSAISSGAVELTTWETVVTQCCVLLVWFAVGVVPMIRLSFLDPPPSRGEPHTFEKARRGEPAIVGLVSGGSALGAVIATEAILDLPDAVFAVAYLGVAALFVLLARMMTDELSSGLVSLQRLVAMGLCAISIAHAAPSLPYFVGGVSVQMAVMHFLSNYWDDDAVAAIAHYMAAAVAFWMLISLVSSPLDITTPFLNPDGIGGFDVVLSLFVASVALNGRLINEKFAKRVYRYTAHFLTLGYFAVQTVGIDGGGYVATGLWGLYSITVLVVGLYRSNSELKWVGFLTLGFSVVKLILFDMHEADTFWRVVVFFGLGMVLLIVSYFSPMLEAIGEDDAEETGGGPPGTDGVV